MLKKEIEGSEERRGWGVGWINLIDVVFNEILL